MAVIQREIRPPNPVREDLKQRLVEEWRDPHPGDVEPLIIEESTDGHPIHVYVIWDDWGDMSLQERADLLMEAFQEVKGLDEVLNVSIAMGITRAEARRMGIQP